MMRVERDKAILKRMSPKGGQGTWKERPVNV